MKKLSILFALLFVSAFTFAQNDASKTLVKTLDPEGSTQIVFDFKHKNIDAKTWDNKGLRLQLEIHSNMPEAILAQLVKAGRYTLEGIKEGDIFYITAPNLGKNVTIGGKNLEEEIIVHVDMPGYMELTGNKLSVSGDFVARGGSSQLKKKMDLNVEFKFVCTDAALAATSEVKTMEEIVNNKKTAAKKSSKDKKAATAAPTDGGRSEDMGISPAGMTKQELQTRFGEILIDGVKFEVE
jgi:hypothetical protein